MPIIAGHYVAAYAFSAGFGGDALTMAVAISKSEAGWNTDYLFKGPETEQRGLWGINWAIYTNFDRVQLMDPTYNAQCAWILWAQFGNTWQAWQSYLDGSWQAAVPAARQAVAEFISLGGDPTNPPAPTPPGGGGSGEGPAPTPPQGLFPILGNLDPTPAMYQFGDNLYSLAGSLDAASFTIEQLGK